MEAPCSKRAGAGHINSLPDELLSQVLKLLPFPIKAAAHTVSQRWNHVLRQPIISDLWSECELDLGAQPVDLRRDKELWQTAGWLARRAYGIKLLVILTAAWRGGDSMLTESGYFFRQQLPYLLGQLHYKGIQLKLSFSTGSHVSWSVPTFHLANLDSGQFVWLISTNLVCGQPAVQTLSWCWTLCWQTQSCKPMSAPT